MACQLQLNMFNTFDLKERKFTNIYKISARVCSCICASVVVGCCMGSRGGVSEFPARDVLIRRWSQQRVCSRVTSTRGIQYWRTAIRWYISYILSQLLHIKKYQKIKKSKNPSYLALAYLPQRQWMNYTTNRTLRLQSIRANGYNN